MKLNGKLLDLEPPPVSLAVVDHMMVITVNNQLKLAN